MAADDSQDLTLGQLLSRGIKSHDTIQKAASQSDPATQLQIQSAISDLTLSSKLINHLGILSPNETIDDINTRDLRCVIVDGLRGQLELLVQTKGRKDRMSALETAQEHLRTYISLVDRYEIVPEEKRNVFQGPSQQTQDPTRRRESKIAQFKMERDIKQKLEELRKRRQTRRPLSSRASSSTSDPTDDNDDDSYSSGDEESSVSRPLFLSLLQLHYLRSYSELSSIAMELELLNSMEARIEELDVSEGRGTQGDRERGREGDEEDGTWKVEQLENAQGPLLDPKGKVLRPFTILPSSSPNSPLSTRLRLQSEVFRSSHRLPTMTIDEFLEQEEEQGRILQGGGPNSSAAVEEARREEKGEKEDDTERGYRAEDEETMKARVQDDWKDTHRKGEGNMHNRG
ncbi:immunoglobulin-binding protein 1, partial [Phenoliferia sp. Uapishka_3]